MSRIPATASVTLAGLLPVCAAALGLGEIQSRSYLNQPLAAEIPVVSEMPGELAGLTVALAPAEIFSQYGLQRPTFLGELSFAVVTGGGGPVIRITSAQPVAEPFVTLLLEVRWPQGRLLREYTILLDPPSFTGGAVRQPAQAPVAAPPPAAVAATPPAEAPAAPPPVAAAGGEDTHVVARNETLWGIADRYRPDPSADINQVMLAIYRANPDAFAGNINRLTAGAVLRLPDRAAVESVGRGEAGAEVRRQNQEWRAATGAIERAARLELVPPAETAAAPAAPAGPVPGAAAPAGRSAAEIEESRRLLAVKDAELQALRQRVAELERQGAGEAAVEPEAPAATAGPIEAEPEAEAAAEEPAAAEAPAPEAAPVAKAPARPVAPRAPAEPSGGILDTIIGLLTSAWLWVAAAVVLLGALLLARRRSTAEEAPAWRPPALRPAREAEEGEPAAGRRREPEDMIVEETPRAQATGGFERRAVPRGDDELPLEKTISTDGPVNLDQSDPLAEADFHMAYGLYDQAADLLTAAMNREPARRDLPLKLLDVYFVWENRDGFLKHARALRQQIDNDADPDWKRVVIMGKQLCPNEPMFAGAAAPAAEEMDLAFSGEGGGGVDLALGGDDGGLDFDLSGEEGLEIDSNAPTKVARPWSSAQTQEIATLEAPGIDGASTMETPTIENAALSTTMETPTIETAAPGRTMETPTIEAPSPEFGSTARLQGLASADERQEQTAEIDLEDLGLDLAGLDDAARDMATGVQEALPDAAGALDFDISAGASPADGEETTAEMEGSPTLNQLTNAVGKGTARTGLADDTAEQPAIGGAGDSMITPALSATSDELESLNIDLELGGADSGAESELTATGLKAIGGRRPEDPTMTEVGTKLDLARAYVDMGDPDGARSILNEVLEEGDPAQRQEARQLLDSLDT